MGDHEGLPRVLSRKQVERMTFAFRYGRAMNRLVTELLDSLILEPAIYAAIRVLQPALSYGSVQFTR